MHFVVTMIILLFFTSRSSKLAGILIESYSAEQHRAPLSVPPAQLGAARCGSAFVRPSNRVCTFHVGKPEAIVCSQLRQGLPTKSQGQDGETIATSCGHSPSTTCLAGKGLDSYAVLRLSRRSWVPPPPRQRASSPVQGVVPDRVKVRSSVRIFHSQTS